MSQLLIQYWKCEQAVKYSRLELKQAIARQVDNLQPFMSDYENKLTKLAEVAEQLPTYDTIYEKVMDGGKNE